MHKQWIWAGLTSLGLLCTGASDRAIAHMSDGLMAPPMRDKSFQQIEQPLSLKAGITIAGLGLMGLELWWFLLSKTKPR